MSFESHKLLGQVRPAGTGTAESLVEVQAGHEVIVEEVVVCNTSAADANYSIYVDDDGDSYGAGMALFYSVALAPNTSVQIQPFWSLNTAGGNIMVETETADALTFTAFGRDIDLGENDR